MGGGEVEAQEGEAGHQEVTQGDRQQQQGRRPRSGLVRVLRLRLVRSGEEEDNEAERLPQHHDGDLQSTILLITSVITQLTFPHSLTWNIGWLKSLISPAMFSDWTRKAALQIV